MTRSRGMMQFFPFTANVDSDEDDQTVYILYIDPQGLTLYQRLVRGKDCN